MSFNRLFALVFVAVFINSCMSTSTIIHKDYEYERMIPDNYSIDFVFHLENINEYKKIVTGFGYIILILPRFVH